MDVTSKRFVLRLAEELPRTDELLSTKNNSFSLPLSCDFTCITGREFMCVNQNRENL